MAIFSPCVAPNIPGQSYLEKSIIGRERRLGWGYAMPLFGRVINHGSIGAPMLPYFSLFSLFLFMSLFFGCFFCCFFVSAFLLLRFVALLLWASLYVCRCLHVADFRLDFLFFLFSRVFDGKFLSIKNGNSDLFLLYHNVFPTLRTIWMFS